VIEGRYRLPEGDVREITALVMQRSDIPKPILRIITSDPNHASLETGREAPGALYSSFAVAKRHGRWRVDSDVETMRIIVTGPVTLKGLTNRSSQPLAIAMRTFDFMKQFFVFTPLSSTSVGSALSR
jgi:hypothetical protein